MAYDNLVCTYHLTPRGWEMADLAPGDAVWTISERTYQRSGFSAEEITWTGVRLHGTVENVRTLLKKYPYPSGCPVATGQIIRSLLEKLSN